MANIPKGTPTSWAWEDDAHSASHAVGGADTVFPADPNADRYLMWDDDPGVLAWSSPAGGGDLLADGTVPLTANWDVGAFIITALQFISDQATGTAPFTVASTTVVTNLNADTVDGKHVISATDAAEGLVELATAAETTTGTDATRAVTPDGLAGSGYGKRTLSVLVNDSTALTIGDGKAYFPRIPSWMNGWNIIEVAANMVAGTGAVTIMIHNLTQTADVLSTALTIDANEKDSKDAATPAVINGAEDDLTTGDRLRIDIDGAGTGTTWLDVQITVQLP